MKTCLAILCLAFASSCLEGAVVIFTPPEPIQFYREEDAPTGEVLTLLDIDQDGSTDFQIAGVIGQASLIRTERGNKILTQPFAPPDLGGIPFPLQDNTMIGLTESPIGLVFISTDAGDGFVNQGEEGHFSPIISCSAPTGCRGPFYTAVRDDPQRSFLGFEFKIDGEEHYGYFDISSFPGSFGATLNGWAYESEPGQAIATAFIPEPSLSVMTMIAIISVSLRRRRGRSPTGN